MEVRFHLAAFQTTTAAVMAQKLLRREGIAIAVMPTPRVIQASCGLSVRFSPAESERVDHLLSAELDDNMYAMYAAVRTADGQNIFQAMEARK